MNDIKAKTGHEMGKDDAYEAYLVARSMFSGKRLKHIGNNIIPSGKVMLVKKPFFLKKPTGKVVESELWSRRVSAQKKGKHQDA